MADDALKMALAGPMANSKLSEEDMEAAVGEESTEGASPDLLAAFEDFEAGETAEDRLDSLLAIIQLANLD